MSLNDGAAGDVADSLDSLYETSAEIADGVDTIADRADEQSSGMREVSAEVADLSAAVEEIASSSEEVAVAAEQADDRASEGEAATAAVVEAMDEIPESLAHPQGAKRFNGRTHQVFGHQFISQVQDGDLVRVHTTPIDASLYPDQVDYTLRPF